jgi:hypothetical protein
LSPGVYELDFVLNRNTGGCSDDCTLFWTSICDASCDGKGDCRFYDETAKEVCDGQSRGFLKEYSPAKNIVCCSGEPYGRADLPARFDVDAEHVARVVRPVQLPDGRLGRMVVYTFK